MDRREFLKLGALFSAAMVVETNPILKAAAETLDSDPLQVIFYKVREKGTNHWKVKGTKYIDIASKKFDTKRFWASSFEVLEIVDNSIAHKTKNRLWKEHGCKGSKGGGFDMHLYNRNGKIVGSRPETKRHMKEIQKIGASLGGKIGGPNSAKAQKESGQIEKFIAGGQRVRDEYWANVTPEKKADHISKLWAGQQPMIDASHKRLEDVYNSLPNEFTTMEMYNALELHGLSRPSKVMLHRKYREQPNGYTKIKRGHFVKIIAK